jgi:hypothetical protein
MARWTKRLPLVDFKFRTECYVDWCFLWLCVSNINQTVLEENLDLDG